MSDILTKLREANAARQDEWENATDKLSLSYLGNALAGELGEACNIIKKIEREQIGLRGSRASVEALGEELADVVIYMDLLCTKCNIDLAEAIKSKFNKTSEKYGLGTRIA